MNDNLSADETLKQYIPYQNPCILVDDYTVYIIGGKTKDGKHLSTTLWARFAISDDQVCSSLQTCPPQSGLFMLIKSPDWSGHVCTHHC